MQIFEGIDKMKLIYCNENDNREYIDFVKSIYKDDVNYRDNISSTIEMFIYGKGTFCENLFIKPVMVIDEDVTIAVATYVFSNRRKDMMQICFFEAKDEYQQAVDLIINEAKLIATGMNVKSIVIGINGHINYGVGFLVDNFDSPFSYGNNYSKPYYLNYFEVYKPKEYMLNTYKNTFYSFEDLEKNQNLINRICKNFNFRFTNIHNLRAEIDIYTYLSNICFEQHPFYFETTSEEDYEMMLELDGIMESENLIFAEKNGQPIGYLLWYPDYNQLISSGESLNTSTIMKANSDGKRVDNCKVIDIAVLPEYQNTGVILGLFNTLFEYGKDKYKTFESGWILDSNIKSKNLVSHIASNEYKHYKIFEIEI